MLAADGRCKVLDAAADGYVRSEDCIVMVLQAADDDTPPCRAILRGSAVGQVRLLTPLSDQSLVLLCSSGAGICGMETPQSEHHKRCVAAAHLGFQDQN